MSDVDAYGPDVHGPIDFVILEFNQEGPLDGPAQALLDLIASDTIRLYDLVVLRKGHDGSYEVLEIVPESGFGMFNSARSGLLGNEDLDMAAEALLPGTVAALIVYENRWAVPFVVAARRAGGEMVATTRIPAQDLLDVLAGLE